MEEDLVIKKFNNYSRGKECHVEEVDIVSEWLKKGQKVCAEFYSPQGCGITSQIIRLDANEKSFITRTGAMYHF